MRRPPPLPAAALALILVCSFANQSATRTLESDRPVPFRVGEVLTYDVGWSTFLTAGTATIVVKERRSLSPNDAAYDIIAEGQPTSLLDKLYHLYYKAETLLNTATLQPSLATLYSDERGRTKLKTTRFVGSTTIEYQPKASGPREKHTVPRLTLDPLSAVYVMRIVPLKAGQIVTMPIVDGTSVYLVRWQISAPEPVKTALGVLPAWRLTPTLTDTKGKPVSGRQVTVWLSDDARRLPLKFEAALTIGSFTLTLARASG